VSQIPVVRERLTAWQHLGLWSLAAAFFFFSFFVIFRGAFLQRHMTDLQVYLRAAWAVRTGADLYAITEENHWHFHYPPLLALAAMPLADAPPGADRTGLLPFVVSVGVWYWVSLACLFVGVNALASAVDPNAIRGSPRWWALRFWSILACLPPIAATLMRGQVNLMVLALLCFAGAGLVRGRSGRAGVYLALAACLKVIPLLLLLYPLWRRDWRCLGGFALGLLAGLLLIPAAWLGPSQTISYFGEWYDVLARPALGTGDDHARDQELILVTSTDSQSIGPTIHNTIHLDRNTRPRQLTPSLRVVHWLGGALMIGVTLLASGWRNGGHRLRPLILLGALILIMLLVSPVCHLHYFCLALPLVMGLLAWDWENQESMRPSLGMILLLSGNFILNGVTHLPVSDLSRDLGVAAHATLALWLVAVIVLWRTRPHPERPGRLFALRGPAKVNTVGQCAST
jgi:hypothetical protein